jgi:hypothetical protein
MLNELLPKLNAYIQSLDKQITTESQPKQLTTDS